MIVEVGWWVSREINQAWAESMLNKCVQMCVVYKEDGTHSACHVLSEFKVGYRLLPPIRQEVTIHN